VLLNWHIDDSGRESHNCKPYLYPTKQKHLNQAVPHAGSTPRLMLTIGLIREGKVPPDARTPLSPKQCALAQEQWPVRFVVQPSEHRAFTDQEYRDAGITVQADVSACTVLMGVKEPPPADLLPDKTYFFFSHTIKKQPYNRHLLQTALERRIRLIDYEVLTDDLGDRLVAFGYFAGIVGAHNGLWAYGLRTGEYELPRLYQCHSYAEALAAYAQLHLPPLRIVLTGSGRVAAGAIRNLHDMGIHGVAPEEFLHKTYDRPVFTQLFAHDYVRRKGSYSYFDKKHFYAHGDEYVSTFHHFAHASDLFINCIYYDKRAPMFFTREDMRSAAFRIKVVADISCDIYPHGSVPTTLRASSIAEPVFGYDPATGTETAPFLASSVDIMAVDNLPSELPRDASTFFGQQVLDHILPALISNVDSPVLERATIAAHGQLTDRYDYLADWVKD
jgi:alanine dehydrogenase